MFASTDHDNPEVIGEVKSDNYIIVWEDTEYIEDNTSRWMLSMTPCGMIGWIICTRSWGEEMVEYLT